MYLRRAITIVLLPILAGCAGYQVGPQSLFRPDLRTVYVPLFESASYRRHLGERLTEAVVKEIEGRTPYKVVHNPDADSVLLGQIRSEQKQVLAEDINDVPREIETDLVVQVHWYDRSRGLIMQSTALPVAPIALSVAERASFIPEAGQSMATAQQEAIQRLAQQVVSQMEMPW
jgi:hypothetical protein